MVNPGSDCEESGGYQLCLSETVSQLVFPVMSLAERYDFEHFLKSVTVSGVSQLPLVSFLSAGQSHMFDKLKI